MLLSFVCSFAVQSLRRLAQLLATDDLGSGHTTDWPFECGSVDGKQRLAFGAHVVASSSSSLLFTCQVAHFPRSARGTAHLVRLATLAAQPSGTRHQLTLAPALPIFAALFALPASPRSPPFCRRQEEQGEIPASKRPVGRLDALSLALANQREHKPTD